MIRLSIGTWLFAAAAVLGGCSNGYYVDLAQVRQQRLATAYEPPAAQRTRVARSTEGATTRAAVTYERVAPIYTAPVNTVTRVDDAKPWPKQGTPEYTQFLAEEAEREKRVQQVLTSICRGC